MFIDNDRENNLICNLQLENKNRFQSKLKCLALLHECLLLYLRCRNILPQNDGI